MSGFLRIIPIILSAKTDDTLDDTIGQSISSLRNAGKYTLIPVPSISYLGSSAPSALHSSQIF